MINNTGDSNINATNTTNMCSGWKCVKDCLALNSAYTWLAVKIVVMVMGILANSALLWLLLKGKKSLSASQVLGLNLSVLNVLYLVCLPLTMYDSLRPSDPIGKICEALAALNMFGCPLLLASMCVERYVAAVHPIVFLKLSRREYMISWSALAWTLTVAVALSFIHYDMANMLSVLMKVMTSLFLLMLACLAGIAWALWRRGPAQTRACATPLKRRALRNVLVVLAPAFVAYLPIAVIIQLDIGNMSCFLIQWCIGFPNFGVFIGPMFYLSQAGQFRLCKKKGDTEQTG